MNGQAKLPTLRQYVYCDCGALMKRTVPYTCRECGKYYGGRVYRREFTLPVPKHVSQRPEVRHDPVAAHYRWASVR